MKVPLERVYLALPRFDITVRRLVDILGIIYRGFFVTRLNFRHLEPGGIVMEGDEFEEANVRTRKEKPEELGCRGLPS
jgi:hypothetical protein